MMDEGADPSKANSSEEGSETHVKADAPVTGNNN